MTTNYDLQLLAKKDKNFISNNQEELKEVQKYLDLAISSMRKLESNADESFNDLVYLRETEKLFDIKDIITSLINEEA